MFEGLRGRARAAALQAAAIEAKVALVTMREALSGTERELAVERKRLEDAERRGELARQVQDGQTVEVAERFAGKHRERVGVLERKLAVQRDELVLAERELAEVTAALHAARHGGEASGASSDSAGSAGQDGARDPSGPEDTLLRHQTDRVKHEAAAEAQLAHLKKKMGKDKP